MTTCLTTFSHAARLPSTVNCKWQRRHMEVPCLACAGGQIENPTSETVSQVATLTVAILAVGGSAVAGTAFFLYKEVSRCIWTGDLHA